MVEYYNSHSSRLWRWRLARITKIRNEVIAKRNARRDANCAALRDWGTAKTPADLALEFYAKAQEYENRAAQANNSTTFDDNLRMVDHYLERSRKADAFV